MNLKKYIGNKAFYKMVLAIAFPIMIQNGISNFVSMLDNIMVGRVGTEQMSAVAIVNQIIMIYYLCLFGGVSGIGIYTAQFFGQKNDEGIRQTMRAKYWMVGLITLVGVLIFVLFGKQLIGLYLTGDSGTQDVDLTLYHGIRYLRIMLVGLPFISILQVYASSLREVGETKLPMYASLAAVLVNLVFNYILIYGKFGAPKLGVEGAAIATVMSRVVEAAIVVVAAHRRKAQFTFLKGLYRTLRVPLRQTLRMCKTSLPLMLNETLWSFGVAFQMQCYSLRGLDVVAAFNISNTVNNLFNVIFIALGDSVAIVVGQRLGAGKIEEAKDMDRKMIAFATAICVPIGAIMALTAGPFFPLIYNTSGEVRHMASIFIVSVACFMPMNACMHSTYFTLRSGGNTLITFLFDSGMMWMFGIPLAFCLCHFTALSIYAIYLLVMASDVFKIILGLVLVKKGIWANNIVQE